MRVLMVLILFVVLAMGGHGSKAYAQTDVPEIVNKDGRETLVLPESLRESIKANFPGFRVPKKDDMIDFWATEPDPFPFIAWGDFNGDKLVDIAIVLISDTQWKFIIFHNEVQKYIPAYEEAGRIGDAARIQVPQQIFLRTVKRGQEWSPEAGDQIFDYKHEFDAIAFSAYKQKQYYIEAFLSLIYWKSGSYYKYEGFLE